MKVAVLKSILVLCISNQVVAMSSDRQFFSIINNTNENFNIELSYGAPATVAKPNTKAEKPNVAVGEQYQDKQLFEFPAGAGVDIQKTEIRRFPMYVRLLTVTPPVASADDSKAASVFQKSDQSIRKQIAIGVDNVNNKNGVVFNSDPQGAIAYKFYDVRPDTKVIKATPLLFGK